MNPSLLQPKSNNLQTTTPAYMGQVKSTAPLVPGAPQYGSQTSTTSTGYQPALGVKAKSPTDGLLKPATTLTSSQTSKVQPNIAPASSPTPPTYNTQTGILTDYGKSVGAPDVNAPKAPSTPVTGSSMTGTLTPTQPAPTDTNTSSNPPPNPALSAPSLASSGLYGQLVQNYIDKSNQSTQFRENLSQAENDRTKQAIPLPFVQGQQGALERDYGIQGTALASQASTAATAASLAKPEANAGFYGSPVTGNIVGNSGTGSGNTILDTAVNQAVQLVNNGASVNDPQVQKLLSPFGLVGSTAFTRAMQQGSGGTYNPTVQSATATQNTSQAVNAQGAAFDLDTQIKNLDNISSLASNFLSNNKLLNPTDNPNLNAGIGTYVGTFNDPAAKLQYNAILGDISKFTSSILASNNGQIPTAVTQQLQSFDPSTLSAPQLIPYLQTLKELGGNQLSVLQSQQQNSSGASGGAYTGAPTSINTTPVATPKSTSTLGSKVTNPYAQAIIGTAMNLWGGVTGIVTGLAKNLFQ